MRFQFHFSERAKDRLGDVAVILVLALSVVASYACGSEPPGGGGDDAAAAQATPRYTFETAAVETSPDPAPGEVEVIPVVAPQPLPVTYEVAEQAFHQGRFLEAVELFEGYVEDKPGNPWGHFMLGLSSRFAGEVSKSVDAFTRAIELAPDHVKSHVNLARVLLEDGRPEEAGEHVGRALEIDPESNDAYRLLGRVSGELGDVDGAIDAYEHALVINEWDVWAMNNLGLLLIRQGRFDCAVLPLARATQLRDDIALFQNNLGMALEHNGYFAEARQAYELALAADPGYTKASANFERIEGRANRNGLTPIDLDQLAQDFTAEIVGWRASLLEGETDGPVGVAETPPIASTDSIPTEAVSDTIRVRLP